MSSQMRMLAVLDLFSPNESVLTADMIMARLGYSRGTAYRYIRELCATGLLMRVGGSYVLGPRIIELDFYIRQSDPILRVSQPVMQELRNKFGCDVLLTSIFEDRVVVTHQERGDAKINVTFGRGRVMPLFRGAASKVVVASLPATRQKRLFDEYRDEVAKSDLGAEWSEFKKSLARIRRAGHAISFAELDMDNVGVAAPIFHDPPNAPCSICLVFGADRYAILDKALVAHSVMQAAAAINEQLKSIEHQPAEAPLQAPVSRRSRSSSGTRK